MFLIDEPIKIEDKLEEIVELMKNAKNIAVLMGAGMSADSGIGTFRGDKGLYKKYPSDVLSRDYFYAHPDKFYEVFNELFSNIFNAKPNEGHNIIAKWQYQGLVNNIYTQNIDYLSQKAIIDLPIDEADKIILLNKVFEMHGTINTFTAKAGGKLFQLRISDVLDENNKINYRQPIEGKEGTYLIKPDVVLFGEDIHHYNKAANDIAEKVDLMFVLGSSLEVYPFANLPNLMRKGKKTIIINKTPVKHMFTDVIEIEDEITRSLKLIEDSLNKQKRH